MIKLYVWNIRLMHFVRIPVVTTKTSTRILLRTRWHRSDCCTWNSHGRWLFADRTAWRRRRLTQYRSSPVWYIIILLYYSPVGTVASRNRTNYLLPKLRCDWDVDAMNSYNESFITFVSSICHIDTNANGSPQFVLRDQVVPNSSNVVIYGACQIAARRTHCNMFLNSKYWLNRIFCHRTKKTNWKPNELWLKTGVCDVWESGNSVGFFTAT